MSLNKLKLLEEITLLYVEDDIENLDEMSIVLSKFFANIYTAEDGDEGLKSFKENKPDVILTDLHMPNMNGVEMIKAIRELDKEVPIIIITAYNREEQKEELKSINFNKFIVKPLDVRKLMEAIIELIDEIKKEY